MEEKERRRQNSRGARNRFGNLAMEMNVTRGEMGSRRVEVNYVEVDIDVETPCSQVPYSFEVRLAVSLQRKCNLVCSLLTKHVLLGIPTKFEAIPKTKKQAPLLAPTCSEKNRWGHSILRKIDGRMRQRKIDGR